MSFRIRPAAAADVPAMHGIRGSVRENRLSRLGRVSQASYLPYVADGSAWVAETEHGISGFAAVDRSKASVWALFVAPDAEGTGIGRALHGHMVEWALEQSICRLNLTTSPGTRAARFYAAAGWREAGVTADGEVCFEKDLGR